MKVKTIALVAHDNLKASMGEWAEYNWGELAKHQLSGGAAPAQVGVSSW